MSAPTLVKHLLTHSSKLSLESLLQQVDAVILHYLDTFDTLSTQQDNIAVQACRYHLSHPGQQVRAKLCLSACMNLEVKYDDMLIISAVAELLHNASLIHDDIQDQDDIRRGYQTVWKKYGTDIAICAGDLLISSAYGLLSGISDTSKLPDLIHLISARTAAAINGQCHDIHYKKNPSNSIEDYHQIAKAKSGALLSLPIELALTLANQKQYLDDAKHAAHLFAIGYQMVDDLNDIAKDATDVSGNKSLNIVFVLADAGSQNPSKEATHLAQSCLSQAILLSEKLPYATGELLVYYAKKLQGQIYDARTY